MKNCDLDFLVIGGPNIVVSLPRSEKGHPARLGNISTVWAIEVREWKGKGPVAFYGVYYSVDTKCCFASLVGGKASTLTGNKIA